MPRQELTITAADGEARAALFTPSSGATTGLPGVLFFMDAFGWRPAHTDMAQRLADFGYVVLMPDLFYRQGEYAPHNPREIFASDEKRGAFFAAVRQTTQAMTLADAKPFLDRLKQEVEGARIGLVGYCMGGTRALAAAGTYPDQVQAVASFHGGNLASSEPDSPHLLAGNIKAQVYIGTAAVDGSFPPEQSTRLVEAFRQAELDFALENYVGAQHGWTVPDFPVYNPQGAERHWRRLESLFAEALH